MPYYIKADLAGHRILLHLNASTRCFDVFRGEQFVKSVPIKGLYGGPMPLQEYIDLMRERARAARKSAPDPPTTSTGVWATERLSFNAECPLIGSIGRSDQGRGRLAFFAIQICLVLSCSLAFLWL